MKPVDRQCIDTIRFLSVDAVERANSGHPGMPMGAAPMAFVLWDRFLKHNPTNPKWFDRDRFVLSAGHGSMLIYSLLHLYGYDVSLEDIQSFRQWGSKTPGHPEYGLTPGVECTTGPLGQGFAMGVGMAMAEAHLAAAFNAEGDKPIVDHFTYAIVSDGDLMEGVACEAASLAGTLGLGKLIYLYDDNHITIDGGTDLSFTESVPARFTAYGWHVQSVDDGNDIEAIDAAVRAAQKETSKPSLICVRTHIGYGSPKQDSSKAHGEPLGLEATRAAKEKLGWPLEPAFYVPDEVRDHCGQALEIGAKLEQEWHNRFAGFRKASPERAALLDATTSKVLPDVWDRVFPEFKPADGSVATRAASGKVINSIAPVLPTMIGGSADLAASNKTDIDGGGDYTTDGPAGRIVHFGVREHAMGAIVNGMALHGGVIPFGATFLIFSDYMRPAIRLAALMNVPSIFVFTHDSIGLGEDGPTHQPIEQLMSLRAIPRLAVFRPADANETAAAWRLSIERSGPCALALTRQNLPVLDHTIQSAYDSVKMGGYILADSPSAGPAVILVATGSEVHLAVEARDALAKDGIEARVVSLPSLELFMEQDDAYRAKVLPTGIPKLVIEAGVANGWRDVIGDNGSVISMDRFGESAPAGVLFEKFGFSVDNVVEKAAALVRANGRAAAGDR